MNINKYNGILSRLEKETKQIKLLELEKYNRYLKVYKQLSKEIDNRKSIIKYYKKEYNDYSLYSLFFRMKNTAKYILIYLFKHISLLILNPLIMNSRGERNE
ncbi:MAG: hypothetical protein IJK61_03575 [Bacteroidetes bacterium]|nr:hypothetical protein [Bacteroidota bacterium]